MDPSWVLTENLGEAVTQRTSTPRVSNVTASDTSVFATDFATFFATARAGLQQRHDFLGLLYRLFYNQQDPGVMLRKVLGMAVFHRKFDVFLDVTATESPNQIFAPNVGFVTGCCVIVRFPLKAWCPKNRRS